MFGVSKQILTNFQKQSMIMAYKQIDNLLDLNDDYLLCILEKLSLIDLCATANTCRRLRFVACEAFKSKGKRYVIPSAYVDFEDHELILRNFGDFVTEFMCLINILGVGISNEQMEVTFDWMERYTAASLKKIIIIGIQHIVLPKSAIRLMSKVKIINVIAPISYRNVRAALLNCSKLVNLKLSMYDGPFPFPDYRFPNLLSLRAGVTVSPNTDYQQIETFFEYHNAMTELGMHFLNDMGANGIINLSFLKHLTNLTNLKLILHNCKVVGAEVVTCLENLAEFCIDSSADKRTDAMILENLASVDSLVKLQLGVPEVSHLIEGIARFRNLSVLAFSSYFMVLRQSFNEADIASLARLRNSRCKELHVSCQSLMRPTSIVNVVTNLKELETIKLFCEVALLEVICEQLRQICDSQKRKIKIVLINREIEGRPEYYDFIKKFNEDHGTVVKLMSVDMYDH